MFCFGLKLEAEVWRRQSLGPHRLHQRNIDNGKLSVTISLKHHLVSAGMNQSAVRPRRSAVLLNSSELTSAKFNTYAVIKKSLSNTKSQSLKFTDTLQFLSQLAHPAFTTCNEMVTPIMYYCGSAVTNETPREVNNTIIDNNIVVLHLHPLHKSSLKMLYSFRGQSSLIISSSHTNSPCH